MDKKYYKNLNILRLIACVLIFLYHLNILKGGYLAVIIFFVLSGYLSCNSIFNDKFSLKKYYLNKLLNLYLPLIFVVFISIAVISLIPSINWMNLKPETTSVILGYNNYWQLNANLDYFTRHVDSPFMHFWYIAILLQFDLILPFICLGLKKIGDKLHKIIPIILTILLGMVSALYFCKLSNTNIMTAYYDTLSRIFACLFGLSLGIFVHYYGNLIPKKFNNIIFNRIITYIYYISLVILMIIFNTNNMYLLMIITTFITIRLICYESVNTNELNKFDRFIKYISSISYEIYLFQYPVIFIFQEIDMNIILKNLLIVLVTILLSFILHICIKIKKDEKFKILKYILRFIILIISLFGIYKYMIAKDYTKEMKELEALLDENTKIMEQNNLDYENRIKENQEKLDKELEEIANDEDALKDYVINLPIVGIGDSVLLGTVPYLSKKFPNGYFEGRTSSTCYEAGAILKRLKKNNKLGNPIIFNYGANGDCSNACKDTIMEIIGDRKLFWVNTTNTKQIYFNDKIVNYAKDHPNIRVIDWYTVSNGHPEYFYKDGIHMRSTGMDPFVNLIYEEIYNDYLKELNDKKQQILEEHEKEERTKISFYGNDLLLKNFEELKLNFVNANYMIDNYNFKSLKQKIINDISSNNINYNVILAFDSSLKLSNKEYKEIIDLFKDNKIYIVNVRNIDLEFDNVEIIDFYKEIKENDNYLMSDKIHLSKEGNKSLNKLLVDKLIVEENEED